MKVVSTREAAKRLGIHFTTLAHYIADGKVPTPTVLDVGSHKLHGWTEAEIEHVRQLLPKIANGRKTRYSKLREKEKTQPKRPCPVKPKRRNPKP